MPRSICLHDLRESAPGAHVAPAEGGGDHLHVLGPLHDAEVDGLSLDAAVDLRYLRVQVGEFPDVGLEAELGQRLGELGHVPADLVEDGAGAPDEHAAVPVEAPGSEELHGTLQVRLFHETLHRRGAGVVFRGGLDVAIAGLGPGRGDAQRHQRTAHRYRAGDNEGGAEGLLIDDVVVGREHHHDAVRVKARDDRRGKPDRRRGVASHRLLDDVYWNSLDVGQLAPGLGGLQRVGDHHYPFGVEREDAFHGPLQHRLAAEDRHELFRCTFAGKGPEPGAGSPCQDDDVHDFLQVSEDPRRSEQKDPREAGRAGSDGTAPGRGSPRPARQSSRPPVGSKIP